LFLAPFLEEPKVMTRAIDTTRRDALKVIAGAPLFPLATSLAGGTTFLFGMKAAAAAPAIASASFISMPAPSLANAAAMATTTVGSSMAVKYADGKEQNFTLAYDPFFITGAKVQTARAVRCSPAASMTSTASRSWINPPRKRTSRNSSQTARTA